ncbi:MAG: hypothetical protein ACRDQ1_15895 [Sciscionella sp.]
MRHRTAAHLAAAWAIAFAAPHVYWATGRKVFRPYSAGQFS